MSKITTLIRQLRQPETRHVCLKIGLIAMGVILSSFQLFNETNIETLSSFTGIKKKPKIATDRALELGTIVPSDLKGQKEVQVLLKDAAISQLWGLKTTDAMRAWQLTTGSRDIVVAIVDTGADIKHPSLVENIWANSGETGKDVRGNDKAKNGVDDDGNGYIDDVHGWNFVTNSNDVSDNHGHGTHIAGIIGSSKGRSIGISPKVSLMILKYYDPKAPGLNNLANTVKAIEYAVKMNSNIINYSGGGLEPSADEKKAIELANRKGILFVAAAGNERSNSDLKAYYPADYGLPNIISITAVDKSQNVLSSSNYGEHSVDLAAPGNEIFSTLPQGQFGKMTGTSQATAFTTGVAALVMASNSELRKADRIVKYLTQTGDVQEGLNGKTRYHKVLNSYKALAIKDSDMSINGTRAENSLHMKSKTFSVGGTETATDPSQEHGANSPSPEREIAEFGKALQKMVDRADKAKASDVKTAAPGI